MKSLLLAVASIVDANTNQGYTSQFIGHSSAQVADHIERGGKIRSKSFKDLLGRLANSVTRLIENTKTRVAQQRATEQLSQLNEHLLDDIGLNFNDVKNLSSGLITMDELATQRTSNQSQVKQLPSVRQTAVNNSIREIESANEDSYGLAKCC